MREIQDACVWQRRFVNKIDHINRQPFHIAQDTMARIRSFLSLLRCGQHDTESVDKTCDLGFMSTAANTTHVDMLRVNEILAEGITHVWISADRAWRTNNMYRFTKLIKLAEPSYIAACHAFFITPHVLQGSRSIRELHFLLRKMRDRVETTRRRAIPHFPPACDA